MVKNCVQCGAEFDARGPKKTCGPECSKLRDNEREARQLREKRANDPEWREKTNERAARRYREKCANDPEWREKERERKARRHREKCANDPEWSEKRNEASARWYGEKAASNAFFRALAMAGAIGGNNGH